MLLDIEEKNGMFLSVRKVNKEIVISVLDIYDDPEYYKWATLEDAVHDYWIKQNQAEEIAISDQEDHNEFYYN